MSIEREVYPRDLNKFQAEELIKRGMMIEGVGFLQKALDAGFVLEDHCDPRSDLEVWLKGPLDKLRKPMRSLWSQSSAEVKKEFYMAYVWDAMLYIVHTLRSLAEVSSDDQRVESLIDSMLKVYKQACRPDRETDPGDLEIVSQDSSDPHELRILDEPVTFLDTTTRK